MNDLPVEDDCFSGYCRCRRLGNRAGILPSLLASILLAMDEYSFRECYQLCRVRISRCYLTIVGQDHTNTRRT